MPTPLFRLDLTRHLDPVLQLARARPDRVQLVAWAIGYLAAITDGLDVIILSAPAPCGRSRCSGPRGSTPCGVRWAGRASANVEAVVGRVTEAVELELLGGRAGNVWEELAEQLGLGW